MRQQNALSPVPSSSSQTLLSTTRSTTNSTTGITSIIWIIPAVVLNIFFVIQSNIYLHTWSSSSSSPSSNQQQREGEDWSWVPVDVVTRRRRSVSSSNFLGQLTPVHNTSDNSLSSSSSSAASVVSSPDVPIITPATHPNNNNDNVTNIPVFYNLYVSPDDDKTNNNRENNETARVRELVIEQLSHLNPDRHYPVYLNSIGKKLSIPNTIQLGHYNTGQETITLHSLWNHCRRQQQQSNQHGDQNDDARVVYLHSKGTLHNHVRNDNLRRFVTVGAVSDQCTNDNNNDNNITCDVCSIRFAPLPHPHVSGNMWTARCSYIVKLPNPIKFSIMMENVPRVHTAPQPYHVGRKRFAAEHWIHSHPSVRPCDVYTGQFTCGYEGANGRLRRNGDVDGSNRNNNKKNPLLQLAEAPRFQLEYFRDKKKNLDYWTGLDARIEEYKVLYNQTPSDTWWGWKLDAWVQQQQQQQEQENNTNNI